MIVFYFNLDHLSNHLIKVIFNTLQTNKLYGNNKCKDVVIKLYGNSERSMQHIMHMISIDTILKNLHDGTCTTETQVLLLLTHLQSHVRGYVCDFDNSNWPSGPIKHHMKLYFFPIMHTDSTSTGVGHWIEGLLNTCKS